jgi:hypothetical protein
MIFIELGSDSIEIKHKGETLWVKEDENGDLSILSDKDLVITPVSTNKVKVFLGSVKHIFAASGEKRNTEDVISLSLDKIKADKVYSSLEDIGIVGEMYTSKISIAKHTLSLYFSSKNAHKKAMALFIEKDLV